MDIIIDPEFSKLLIPLADEEFQLLEKSIVEEGCRDHLIVWTGTNILIDGHNRYKICTKHEIPFEVNYMYFEDRMDAYKWIISNQLGRRNITPEQASYLRGKRYNAEKKAASFNQGISGNPGGKPKAEGGQNVPPEKTADRLAREFRVTDRTIKRDAVYAKAIDTVAEVLAPAPEKTGETLKTILARESKINKQDTVKLATIATKAPEEARAIVQAIREGGAKTVREARQKQNKAKAIEEIGRLDPLEGMYDVIVIDPPWAYEKRAEDSSHRAMNPYPSMSIEEIRGINIPASENCVLWLWTTNAFIFEVPAILQSWGFEHKTILTWVKDRFGLGDWLRGQTEHCILAVRGKPVVLLRNQTTVLHGPLREHSRKPDAFYELVETLCVGRKLEMFSRQPREGWTQHGCERDRFLSN